MKTFFEPDEKLRCPHCNRQQEMEAGYYPRAFRTGPLSREDYCCEHCDEAFTAERVNADKVSAEKM